MLQLLLAVFIGGGTGSVARWLLSMRFNPLHQAIPLGTLAANLIGAFIIGMGFAWFSRMTNIDPVWTDGEGWLEIEARGGSGVCYRACDAAEAPAAARRALDR